MRLEIGKEITKTQKETKRTRVTTAPARSPEKCTREDERRPIGDSPHVGEFEYAVVWRGSILVGVDCGPKEQNHSWKQTDSGQIGVDRNLSSSKSRFCSFGPPSTPTGVLPRPTDRVFRLPSVWAFTNQPSSIFSGEIFGRPSHSLGTPFGFLVCFSDLIFSLHIFSTVSLY